MQFLKRLIFVVRNQWDRVLHNQDGFVQGLMQLLPSLISAGGGIAGGLLQSQSNKNIQGSQLQPLRPNIALNDFPSGELLMKSISQEPSGFGEGLEKRIIDLLRTQGERDRTLLDTQLKQIGGSTGTSESAPQLLRNIQGFGQGGINLGVGQSIADLLLKSRQFEAGEADRIGRLRSGAASTELQGLSPGSAVIPAPAQGPSPVGTGLLTGGNIASAFGQAQQSNDISSLLNLFGSQTNAQNRSAFSNPYQTGYNPPTSSQLSRPGATTRIRP